MDWVNGVPTKKETELAGRIKELEKQNGILCGVIDALTEGFKSFADERYRKALSVEELELEYMRKK